MTDENGLPLVSAQGVGLRFGRTVVLRDVDLDVAPGAHVVVTGRSGGGKTTLLLALAGLVAVTDGTVRWPGLSSARSAPRSEIGMVFQAPSLMPELTALENVTLPQRLRGVPASEARRSATQALAEVAAEDLGEALPAELSGGQQQRVAVARALAGRHRLVFADEPTGSLDRRHAREVALALRDGVAATGGALVLATHDPELADMFDQEVAVVDGTVHTAMRSR